LTIDTIARADWRYFPRDNGIHYALWWDIAGMITIPVRGGAIPPRTIVYGIVQHWIGDTGMKIRITQNLREMMDGKTHGNYRGKHVLKVACNGLIPTEIRKGGGPKSIYEILYSDGKIESFEA
jgi:hypothetical protein